MEKKEFPNTLDNFKVRKFGYPAKTFSIIKFILGICILPFVYSGTVAFIRELSLVAKIHQHYFWAGVIGFVIVYIFVFEPAAIYRRGFRLLQIIFSFFSPLIKVAPYVLPIYTLIILFLYLMLSLFVRSKGIFNIFLLLIGFSTALHLVFSSKTLRSKKDDFLRANYIFGFSFIYIINILLLALCLSLVFEDCSFISFFNSSFQIAQSIFYVAIKQLFL